MCIYVIPIVSNHYIIIESKQKYTEEAAILRGKNVQWVAVGDSISCYLVR